MRAAAFIVLSACWRGDPPPPPAAPAPAKVAPAPPAWTGPCRGGWGEVTIEELSVVERGETFVVRGVLAFANRRARATLHGSRHALRGSMTELDGLGTVWKLRLVLELDGDVVHGQFFEIIYDDRQADLCAFDLQR